MSLLFYRLIYFLLKNLVFLLQPFSEGLKKLYQLRSAYSRSAATFNPRPHGLWIHASSGEIEYAKPLIKALKKQNPALPITVTYSSSSAEKLFSNIRADVDHFIPAPWDQKNEWLNLIEKIQPEYLIFSRTDLWPTMVATAIEKNIPLGLLAYYPKQNFYNSWLIRKFLGFFKFVSCVNKDVQDYVQLQLPSQVSTLVSVDGDTRFDQVFIRLTQPTTIDWPSSSPLGLTLGSTWPEDEENCWPLIEHLLAGKKKVALCPHDVSLDNILRLKNRIAAQQNFHSYDVRLLSEITRNPTEETYFDLMIVDRIGVLADLYRYTDIAFVGGSYKSRVHSVMEPLAAGCPVLVGPYIQNSPEALQYSNEEEFQFVKVCEDEDELIEAYQKWLTMGLPRLKSEIVQTMQNNQGATEKIMKAHLSNLLKTAKT